MNIQNGPQQCYTKPPGPGGVRWVHVRLCPYANPISKPVSVLLSVALSSVQPGGFPSLKQEKSNSLRPMCRKLSCGQWIGKRLYEVVVARQHYHNQSPHWFQWRSFSSSAWLAMSSEVDSPNEDYEAWVRESKQCVEYLDTWLRKYEGKPKTPNLQIYKTGEGLMNPYRAALQIIKWSRRTGRSIQIFIQCSTNTGYRAISDW